MSRHAVRRLLAVPALALAGAAALATPASAAAEGASAEIEFSCDGGIFWATATITNNSDAPYFFTFALGTTALGSTVAAG